MPTTSTRMPSFFDNHIICLIDGSRQRPTENYTSPSDFGEGNEQSKNTNKSFSEIKAILGKFLKDQEIEVLFRVVLDGDSYNQIGNDLSLHRGNVRKTLERAIVKCRIDAATNLVLDLLCSRDACTVDPITLEYQNFSGYAVSKKDDYERFSKMPSYEQIFSYLWKHRELLNFSGKQSSKVQLYIGCSQTEDSNWMLELNFIEISYARAIAWAILEGQENIYDFQKGKYIKVVYPSPPSF